MSVSHQIGSTELGRYYPQHEEFVVSPPVVTSGMHESPCGHIHTLNE